MSLLVFGQSGQVAQELARLAPGAVFLGRSKLDLANPGAVGTAIAEHAPSAVINAAAYTAVDRAEEEESLARSINGTAPRRMAEACSEQVSLLCISRPITSLMGRGTRPASRVMQCLR